jgi:hypothetical protein
MRPEARNTNRPDPSHTCGKDPFPHFFFSITPHPCFGALANKGAVQVGRKANIAAGSAAHMARTLPAILYDLAGFFPSLDILLQTVFKLPNTEVVRQIWSSQSRSTKIKWINLRIGKNGFARGNHLSLKSINSLFAAIRIENDLCRNLI